MILWLATFLPAEFESRAEVEASTVTSGPTSTSLSEDVVEVVYRTYSAEDVQDHNLVWKRVDLPGDFGNVAALGESTNEIVVMGGPQSDDEVYSHLDLVRLATGGQLEVASRITDRDVIVEEVLISDRMIAIAATADPVDHVEIPEDFLYVSRHGGLFEEFALDQGAGVQRILSMGSGRGATWAFGARVETGWSAIVDALPLEVRVMLRDGTASLAQLGDEIIGFGPFDVEFGRFSIDELVSGPL